VAITFGARTGVALWSDPADHPLRADFTATHQAIEDKMALDVQGTLAARPVAGIRGRYYWATDDRGGRLSRDDGVTWADLGPKPIDGPVAGGYTARIVGHASAGVADPVLVLRGKTGQTGDLMKVQDPTGATDWVRVGPAGGLFANASATFQPGSSSSIGFLVNGLVGQTGDLQQWQVAGTVVGRIDAAGGQTISRSSGGVSQTITAPAGTFHDGSLVISRTATSGHQSLAFVVGTAYSMAIGRAAFSDDLSIRRWNGTAEDQLYKFAAAQAVLTLDSQAAASSNYLRFERQGTFKGLAGISKGGGDLATGDVDGDLVFRYGAGGVGSFRAANDGRTNFLIGTNGAVQVLPASTAGVGITVNPDAGYTNFLQQWQVGGVGKAQVNYDGTGAFVGNLLVGAAALGATSGRNRFSADGTWAYLVAEDQAGNINKGQMFQAGGNGWLWQANAGTTIATLLTDGTLRVATPASSGARIGPGALSGTLGYVEIYSNGATQSGITARSATGSIFDLTAPIQPDGLVRLCANGGTAGVAVSGAPGAVKLGFYGATPALKQTVSGSRGGNAALASLLSALSGQLGLVTDSTTA
jgi:hypothetical protein